MTTATGVAAMAAAAQTLCATTMLPMNAVIHFANGVDPMTLTQDVTVHMPCPTLAPRALTTPVPGTTDFAAMSEVDKEHRWSDFRDPFYATIWPMCYALAGSTIMAWMLVIVLLVTQRSFFDGGMIYLGRRGGFTHSSNNGFSIGGRPWLQKVAALTVAISLTIATADTFRAAELHYQWGIQSAKLMQVQVMGTTQLKAIRIVSDTFLWLAQAQTLIRLFPRQRERTIIKWAAFALITLDLVFSALNSFEYSDNGVSGTTPPNNFVHPVPALSYLFQLALGILYAAWVIYYSIMMKRYAFYHPLMRNISLVAILGITSVVLPVVFFIIDISNPDFAGWGDYVRWVGAAAASVVVWEWVDRIEALERAENKDGILGREVFDGDDTPENNTSDLSWFGKSRKDYPEDGGEEGRATDSGGWAARGINRAGEHAANGGNDGTSHPQMMMGSLLRPPIWPSRPAPVATPVSRTDTTSAASTVYAVRYPPPLPSEPNTQTPEPITWTSHSELSQQHNPGHSHHANEDAGSTQPPRSSTSPNGHSAAAHRRASLDLEAGASASQAGWRNVAATNPAPASCRAEAMAERQRENLESHTFSPARSRSVGSRWGMRAKLEEFAANQAERIRERISPSTDTENLPVTVIPAPPRQGAALQQVLEQEEVRNEGLGGRHDSESSPSMDLDNLGQTRSTVSNVSRGPDGIPVNNPPLWPGVQPQVMYDDDYSSYDGDSISDGSIMSSRDRPGPDDTTGTAGTSSRG